MALPFEALVLFLFLHFAAGAVLRLKGLFLILLLALASLVLVWGMQGTSHPVYTLCVYSCLIMLYLHFYIGVDRSVSVRVLNELLRDPSRRLTLVALGKVYPSAEMFQHRVRLMINKGWIRDQGAKLYASGKARLLVEPTRLLRRVYGLKSTW